MPLKKQSMQWLKSISAKQWYLVTAVFCFGLIGGAVIIQNSFRLIPCPLCIAQRIFFGLTGLAALAGFFGWLESLRYRVIAWLMLVLALMGGSIAARQVCIQHFPQANSDPTKCIVSFGSALDDFLRALGGLGNCAVRDFTLFGLALPEWSLLSFFGLIAVSLWLLFSPKGDVSE